MVSVGPSLPYLGAELDSRRVRQREGVDVVALDETRQGLLAREHDLDANFQGGLTSTCTTHDLASCSGWLRAQRLSVLVEGVAAQP